ncbi:MAG TPA: acyl carrier protein [Ktedonobacteraceae bacterium]|nr:acyl carrier protein [Ktedonobacteraceae bacterium]
MSLRCNIESLLDILHAKVGVPRDTPNIDTASWEEIGVESLGLTEVCTSLEHKLGIAIPHEEVLVLKNVQELVAYVNAIEA